MTMHLARGLTTINTKKPKQKKHTQAQLDKLKAEWKAYNKRMRKLNCHSAQFDTFEQYLSYLRGEAKPRKKDEFKPLQWEPQVRKTKEYPSLSDKVGGFAPKKEPIKYTGDYITGIATMHKSNLVPISSKKQAVEVSQMRRN
jgi:hypothetical protein